MPSTTKVISWKDYLAKIVINSKTRCFHIIDIIEIHNKTNFFSCFQQDACMQLFFTVDLASGKPAKVKHMFGRFRRCLLTLCNGPVSEVVSLNSLYKKVVKARISSCYQLFLILSFNGYSLSYGKLG